MVNLDLCLNYLEQGKCILLLGPRFALDTDGNLLHKKLKDHLRRTAFKDKLDLGFDNLFIFKDAKPSSIQKMQLNIELRNFFEKEEPHEIYQKIPYLPFEAVISCSPDLYLKQAFEEEKVPFFFQYYSHKGVIVPQRKGDAPILFNVFGNIEIEDSLITTFENFFKFIISIIGDEQKIPVDLQNVIAKAKLLVFCGFDLTKWYIPLLVHKLNTFRIKEETDLSVALINKDNFHQQDTGRFYPLDILIEEDESVPMIEQLYQACQQRGILRQLKSRKNGESTRKIKRLIAENKINQAITELINYSEKQKLSSSPAILLKGRYVNLQERKHQGIISPENETLEINQIRQSLISLLGELENA